MRRLLVIGIGAGDPDHLTLQAVAAMGSVDVFFLLDKGTAPALAAHRDRLIATHGSGSHRVAVVVDAERDRDADAYQAAVQRWHADRADRLADAIDAELGPDAVGGLLVWGDPMLYDSTLRIVDQLLARSPGAFEVEVVPGITSVQALAAAHHVPLHDVGAPVHLTTGRRLADDWDGTSTVVLLDGQQAFTAVEPTDVEILWGAYLGTPDQLLVRGPLAEVADRITTERAAARQRHGWIMDTYLLRRPPR
jgi:precorrin-6A synthase